MPPKTTARPYFTPKTLSFLRGLKRHNERAWFIEHKARYETDVRAPCLALIADLQAGLAKISPTLVADPRPQGGSLFRIHRDVRFSADKRPYKTYAGMSFFHCATRASARTAEATAEPGRLDAPGLYLHIEPGASFVGGGIWHPQPRTLKRVRDFMIDNPHSWKQATRARAFASHFALTGDSLVRVPRGYRADHELVEDLKRKDIVASSALSDEDLLSPDLRRLLLARLALLRPLYEWLFLSLGLDG